VVIQYISKIDKLLPPKICLLHEKKKRKKKKEKRKREKGKEKAYTKIKTK